MKKILFALALLAAFQFANAQMKPAATLTKAIDAAEAAAQNPKKADKVATWIKLGQAYLNAYNNPLANVVGGSMQELGLVMGNDKPLSTEVVTLSAGQFTKQTFADKNLYFDGAGQLVLQEITKPVIKDALPKALEAFKKAASLDASGSKSKDISAAISQISQRYYQEAFNAYYFGDSKTASEKFGLAAEASMTAPCTQLDTSSVYYAAVTALEGKDYSRAENYFKKALGYGYESDGSIYANLAEVSLSRKDTLDAKNWLESGFSKYPENAQVMANLINLYISTNEDPAKLITLLDKAKAQMPDNPSLYYVEGDLRAKLHQFDEAVAAYRKAAVVNPEYEMGFYGEGVMFYNRALELQEEANALPYSEYKKYEELTAQLSESLKKCLDPFEKCFALTKNDAVKQNVADYLKRIYFIFRSESPEYMAGYEKYENFLKGE